MRAPSSHSSSLRASRIVEDDDTTREVFHDDDVSTTRTPDSDVVSIEKERNGNFSSEVRTRAPESRAMSPPTPKHNILASVAKNSSSASLRSHSDSHNQYYSHRSSFNRSNSEVDDVSAVSMESRDGIIDSFVVEVYLPEISHYCRYILLPMLSFAE